MPRLTMPHKKSPAGTNSNTKTYWRRVSQMAHGLVRELVYAGSNNSVTEIIAFVDPKATQAMHREAIKMAIQDCSQMEHVYTELFLWSILLKLTVRLRSPNSLTVLK